MIADEIEIFLIAYFDHVCHYADLFQQFKSAPGSEEFAIKISEGYLGWLEKKRSYTTDEVFLVAINFMLIKNFYRGFKLDLNTGGAVIIEWPHKEVLSLYFYTWKKHYFDIVFGMME